MPQALEIERELLPTTIPAFEAVYKKYYPLLYSLSYRVLKRHQDCEEVIHDVFLKLWRDKDEMVLQTSLKAYLSKAVINTSLNHVNRTANLQGHHKQIFLQADKADYTDELERSEKINVVRKEIEKLPEQCRKVFELSRFEERPHKEIAEELNISIKTVKAHIGNALRILKNSTAFQKLLSWFSIIYLSI